MPISGHESLSARERQVLGVIYALGEGTATDVLRSLPSPPSRTSVRTFLRILEEKGHLRHKKRGREYVYRATRSRTKAGRAAVKQVLRTFFDGSLAKAVALHLSDPTAKINDEELRRLEAIINDAKRQDQETD